MTFWIITGNSWWIEFFVMHMKLFSCVHVVAFCTRKRHHLSINWMISIILIVKNKWCISHFSFTIVQLLIKDHGVAGQFVLLLCFECLRVGQKNGHWRCKEYVFMGQFSDSLLSLVLQLKNFRTHHSCGTLHTYSSQCIRWDIIFSEEGFGYEWHW